MRTFDLYKNKALKANGTPVKLKKLNLKIYDMMYDPSFHYVSSHPIDIDSKNKDDNTL